MKPPSPPPFILIEFESIDTEFFVVNEAVPPLPPVIIKPPPLTRLRSLEGVAVFIGVEVTVVVKVSVAVTVGVKVAEAVGVSVMVVVAVKVGVAVLVLVAVERGVAMLFWAGLIREAVLLPQLTEAKTKEVKRNNPTN